MVADDTEFHPLFLELFGGLPRAAPGSDAATRQALALVPPGDRHAVLDVGCGPGAQTLTLGRALPDALILAFDLLPMMVEETRRRCRLADLDARTATTVADMARPPVAFRSQDLIWCEGAIYILGVESALRLWRPLLTGKGCVVFTEPVWLRPDPPREVASWWLAEYPAMTDGAGIERSIEAAGLELIAGFDLPSDAWWDDYYRPLEARIPDFLARHPDDGAAAAVAHEATAEISIFRRYAAYYSYRFFVTRPRR